MLQRKACKIVDILKGGSDLSVFKETQKLRGLKSGYVRAPLLDITEEEKQVLSAQLREFF